MSRINVKPQEDPPLEHMRKEVLHRVKVMIVVLMLGPLISVAVALLA